MASIRLSVDFPSACEYHLLCGCFSSIMLGSNIESWGARKLYELHQKHYSNCPSAVCQRQRVEQEQQERQEAAKKETYLAAAERQQAFRDDIKLAIEPQQASVAPATPPITSPKPLPRPQLASAEETSSPPPLKPQLALVDETSPSPMPKPPPATAEETPPPRPPPPSKPAFTPPCDLTVLASQASLRDEELDKWYTTLLLAKNYMRTKKKNPTTSRWRTKWLKLGICDPRSRDSALASAEPESFKSEEFSMIIPWSGIYAPIAYFSVAMTSTLRMVLRPFFVSIFYTWLKLKHGIFAGIAYT